MDLGEIRWEVCGLDSSGSGPVMGSCEHGNEPLGSIKGEEFDWVSDYQLLKEDSALS
jgi:hypothetical protein